MIRASKIIVTLLTHQLLLVKIGEYMSGVSVYPETETETRVTDLSVSDGYLIMIRFWTRIV